MSKTQLLLELAREVGAIAAKDVEVVLEDVLVLTVDVVVNSVWNSKDC